MHIPYFRDRLSFIVALILLVAVFVAPLRAQQPPPASATQQKTTADDPTFDTLLSDDSYKLYVEVRNVGTLLTTGGAGEIIEPIVKLADPGPELKSLIKFLKDNSEALAASRLMIATWPARTGIPSTMAAIEFATPEDANKFTPKLETFLPSVMPPIPLEEPKAETTSTPAKAEGTPAKAEEKMSAEIVAPPNTATAKPARPTATPPANKPETRSRYVLTRMGTLVVISDTPVNLAKLHPRASGLLFEDNNFRAARDHFATEPVFFFFNVKLEDKTQPKPSPTPVITEEEQERIRKEEEARQQKEAEAAEADKPDPASGITVEATTEGPKLTVEVTPQPTPTPTKEQEVQRAAGNQMGALLSMLGQGQPQWPDAIGLAVALDNEEYVVRAILIQPDTAKRLTLPFVPQLISGPQVTPEAPSILPSDTEILVTTSIDFAQTYQAMRAQMESIPKDARQRAAAISGESLDPFADFEKKAGFKIADDLLPVLGNEMAVAMSLKQANVVSMFGVPAPPSPKSSGDEKKAQPLPVFMIAIRDRDAAKRIMPRVLQGLGIGEANLLAQTERRGDAEIVSYANIFAYAFIGNFLVVSDAATVRRVADAQTNSTTLMSNNAFRTSRHWQPRQTLGEIYVSPAIMEGYQEQVSKQAGTMDQSMRDFLLKLSPKSSAITYALSHDVLGAMHELHLPKNLILAMIASTTAAMSAMKEGSPEMNEMIAMSALRMIAGAEETFKSTAGHGSYGSIDQLVEQKLVSKEIFEKYGYRFDVTTSSNGFEAVAMPLEYGKSGRRSFFIDQSAVLRGDDHGGGPATTADKPVQQ